MNAENEIRAHYDALVDEGNDPVCDPPALRAYMDRWDGTPFLQALSCHGEESVLELGVGTGRLACRVVPRCKRFVGMDLSPKSLARAKEHLAAYAHVHLICADFMAWDTEAAREVEVRAAFSEGFDVIYSSLTFLHVSDKRAACQKVAGWLRNGGRFVLSIDRQQDEWIDMGTRRLKLYPDTRESTAQHLREAGLRIEACQETEAAYIFVARAPL